MSFRQTLDLRVTYSAQLRLEEALASKSMMARARQGADRRHALWYSVYLE